MIMMSVAILPSVPVTSARPGGRWHAEAKLLAQRRLHLKTLIAERRQRARGAGELADQHARLQLLKPFRMAVEHREPDRGLVAEGDRQCLLQMGASGHGRVAIAPREIGEDAPQLRDVVFD